MRRKLIPRASLSAAEGRLAELQRELAEGASLASLPIIAFGDAVVNPTGGEAPRPEDLQAWRSGVMDRLQAGGNEAMAGPHLGKALAEIIDPAPSDAAHPEVWSFLTLWIFPDVVAARWPLHDGVLPKDRWLGSQGGGRDRNHLKTWWRRWCLFGDLLLVEGKSLGEDELVNLTERSALARNSRLVRAAARVILSHPGSDRMTFSRELLKALTYQTGPLALDALDDEEMEALVTHVAAEVQQARGPRRALL